MTPVAHVVGAHVRSLCDAHFLPQSVHMLHKLVRNNVLLLTCSLNPREWIRFGSHHLRMIPIFVFRDYWSFQPPVVPFYIVTLYPVVSSHVFNVCWVSTVGRLYLNFCLMPFSPSLAIPISCIRLRISHPLCRFCNSVDVWMYNRGSETTHRPSVCSWTRWSEGVFT